jgi:lipopolysaccharide transport system permease protein
MITVPWPRTVGPLVLAELRLRHAGSFLGSAWAVVEPLLEVAAYTVVFGLLLGPAHAGDGIAFAFFVASGLLPWSSLRESLEGAGRALTESRWIRRSRVPFELLVARGALSAAVRAAAGLALVWLYAVARDGALGPAVLLLPVLALGCQVAACFGLGLLLAPAAVRFPDLRPALTSGLTLLTFASPILYHERLIPLRLLGLLEWNPFTHFLRLYRLPLGGTQAGASGIDLAVVVATPLLLVGLGSLLGRRLYWAARDRL